VYFLLFIFLVANMDASWTKTCLDTVKCKSDLMCICSPISNCKKLQRKYLTCICTHSMCACKVPLKIDIFCAPCNKDKKMSREMPYFSIKICHFYTGCTKGWILLKQLCWHLGCGDIDATFDFDFLIFFNMFKMHTPILTIINMNRA
jgi:hypothetical protein